MPEAPSINNPLAIIGDEDVVLGFKALGFKVYAVEDSTDFKTTLDKAAEEKRAICLVQDNIYSAAEEQIKSYQALPLPIFIPFSKSTDTDLLNKIVRDIRIRATGAF